MITVLLSAPNDAQHLARSLTALVPAAVEGLVRDAYVVGARNDEEIEAVADAAGAELIGREALTEAITASRGEWLLLMEGGARPLDGWMTAVREWMEEPGRGPASFTLAGKRKTLFGFLEREEPLRRGVLMRKADMAAAGADDLKALARGQSTKRLSARMAPPA
ncbi:glycosyl transferase [Afifella sp. JA880]|uniref:glycosyl transferase n=1 Tax=Afifella sp. JA880 TaxID=2975280 RepID=UPI0021BAA129|nr:glycosyl transferase [Afifella sp. JA880]MCT8266970.1 glycosyl transferase [Afifella sp. JA880]